MNYLHTKKRIHLFMLFLMILLPYIPIHGLLYAGETDPNQMQMTLEEVVYSDPPASLQLSNQIFISGDGVNVSTFPDTASFLHQTFAIDANGMVEFPIVGKINITSMSEKQLEEYLTQNFKNYLRYPIVKVKPVIRISIVGGVIRPGLYYVDDDYSLWDALYLTGGPLSEDGFKEMHLERNSEIIYDNLIPYFERGISLKNMGVKTGDQIWVPSPDRPGFWQDAALVMPFLAFATSLILIYLTYQQILITAQNR
jgi:protein involved in polysaccharide export with SLBB domain